MTTSQGPVVLTSIIIPVHNEAENIERLIREIQRLPHLNAYEIVVVDDASADQTPSVLASMNVPGLTVIRHKRQYGQSAAIVTGIAHAEGQLIVTMDGDGQNDPGDIPRLIETLQAHETCRMVVGHRKKRHDSVWRILSSRIANAVRRVLLRDDTPDTGCGLKAFYRTAFQTLPMFDHMHRFLPALIQMQGGGVMSMEVNHRARTYGQSHYGTVGRLGSGVIDLLGVYWLRRRSSQVCIREVAQYRSTNAVHRIIEEMPPPRPNC